MTAPTPDPADGLLVITMINRLTGDSESEAYEVVATNPAEDALLVLDTSDTRWYEIVQRPVPRPVEIDGGRLTPEQRVEAAAKFGQLERGATVDQYQDLIRALIAADEPCPAYNCSVTHLGHLIASLTADQVELVRELDPEAP